LISLIVMFYLLANLFTIHLHTGTGASVTLLEPTLQSFTVLFGLCLGFIYMHTVDPFVLRSLVAEAEVLLALAWAFTIVSTDLYNLWVFHELHNHLSMALAVWYSICRVILFLGSIFFLLHPRCL